jgi:hypothetical protein
MVVVSKENGAAASNGSSGSHGILSSFQRRAAASMFGATTSSLRSRSGGTTRSRVVWSVAIVLLVWLLYEWVWTYWLPGALMTNDTEIDWERGRTVTRRRPDLLTRTDHKSGTVRAKYVKCMCHAVFGWLYQDESVHCIYLYLSELLVHATRSSLVSFALVSMMIPSHCAALMFIYICIHLHNLLHYYRT